MTSRGIRNNNPGNIRIGDPWKGLAFKYDMTDEQLLEKEFCVFVGPSWGIRAICKILLTYRDKYGLHTIREMISRWAPPSENDTDAYVDSVAERTGLDPDSYVEIRRPKVAGPIIEAIIYHENGEQPYTWAVTTGMKLAGIT